VNAFVVKRVMLFQVITRDVAMERMYCELGRGVCSILQYSPCMRASPNAVIPRTTHLSFDVLQRCICVFAVLCLGVDRENA
jgi:hypothetical protein